MKRTARLVGGLAGVVLLSTGSAGVGRAEAAQAPRRTVAVATPSPGKIAVAVVRFRARPGRRAPRLRLVHRYRAADRVAAAAGVARVASQRGAYIGLVAVVNFAATTPPSLSTRPPATLRIAADRRFVLDYRGDAERYRGGLRTALLAAARRGWRVEAATAAAGADARYRRGRALLAQVARVLAGRGVPAFLAAVHGPQPTSTPPPAPPPAPLPPGPSITAVSSDPFTNADSQHRTQVEPDSFAYGSTIVAGFQSGRFYDGGASGIGFATSRDGGATWTHGFLPGITVNTLGAPGPYTRVSDPSVAFDARHGVWLTESLALSGNTQAALVVSRSTDGLTWSGPVTVASGSGIDKNWIVCDDTAASPHYGNCYSEWDDEAAGQLVQMTTSGDGGLTWSAPASTADSATGIAGQPVVRPDGTVVVPFADKDFTALLSFRSINGGATWSASTLIDAVTNHGGAAGLRMAAIPSAEIDGAGTVYVTWNDCVRAVCNGTDLVISKSATGETWSSPATVPLDSAGRGDYFIPGLGVDPSTAGANAHLALAYYYYPDAACSFETCELSIGFVTSADGGAGWSQPTRLAGPMPLSWLPDTTGGRMVGDYISTSFANGVAWPFFAVAKAPSSATLDQAIYTIKR